MAINQHYPVGCGVCLGVFHIIFGLGSCGCGIAAFILGTFNYEIAVGIWAGICFYLVTGILGLVSSTRNSCVIKAYYVMSLLSTFVAMGQMGWYGYTIYLVLGTCDYHDQDHDWFYTCTYWLNSSIMAGTAGFIGFLEWIMAMSSACTSCSCCCCCCCSNSRPTPEPQTVMINTIPTQLQQYMTQPDGIMSVSGHMQPQVPQPQPPQPQPAYMAQPGGSMSVSGPMYYQPAPVYTEKPDLTSGGMSVSGPMPHEQARGAVSGVGPLIDI